MENSLVKSCYRELIKSRIVTANPIWKLLWKCKLHERLKVHLWRVLANALPTRELMARRLGHEDSKCNICDIKEESSLHIFQDCHLIRLLAFGCKMGGKMDYWNCDNMYQVVYRCLKPSAIGVDRRSDHEFQILWATLFYMVWQARCVLFFEGKLNMYKLVSRFNVALEEFSLDKVGEDGKGYPASVSSQIKWRPPPLGWIKVNVDAAYSRRGRQRPWLNPLEASGSFELAPFLKRELEASVLGSGCFGGVTDLLAKHSLSFGVCLFEDEYSIESIPPAILDLISAEQAFTALTWMSAKVMNSKGPKFVRFEDWKSEKSVSSEQEFSTEDGLYPRKAREHVSQVLGHIRRSFKRGYERIRSLRTKASSSSSTSTASTAAKSRPDQKEAGDCNKKIFNPQGAFLQRWNKIFALSCVIAVSLDPLFLYIPTINNDEKCLSLDRPLEITACVLRTFTDIFYVVHIIFKFRTGFIAPSSRVFGRGELIDDPVAIAKRYLSSNFIIDVLAILPLPQVAVLVVIPEIKGPVALATKNILKYVIICQYVPRFIRILPFYREVTRTSGILTETAYAGAALNLFLYMLASHMVGALWYLFSIEQVDSCWRDECKRRGWNYRYLYCSENGHHEFADTPKLFVSTLNASCPFIDPDKNDNVPFNFGIYADALKSRIVEFDDISTKIFYCFWWGLRNLSSFGQNLKTSTYVGEILFAVLISILGLVLFSLLIGNMQKYLQSTAVRIEEMRVRRRDAEQWMSHRMLPVSLKERIRRYEQYKWQETRGVEEDTLVRNLPKDIRRDIKRHLCLGLLMRVPMFEQMDEQLLDALCDRLKPILYTQKSFIVREGDPVDEMLFIMRGCLATMTTNGGRTGFFNSVVLKAGDFCGEELLTWALDPISATNLPISTRTVEALTEVEAFALMADDLKFVASQFRRLHSKQLQHTFKFYSQQWRTWAACFIQAAWRRHCKRKHDKCLREAEDRLQNALANDVGTTPSLGATIYASRFASNALRALRQNGARNPRPPQRLLPLLPQKPAEPDFTAVGGR
ncbi:hypothetical protein FNV43_RR18152 [Rhamnella rubrinervis]|uniref:Cyclic nucleotide-binding domain-containing protein n=1 Tax=Rhamnella rubrinervis TaxID=2594499 RepID=A0A8K0E599_9ROSA|nr:hypothetical protein FNV43_RR18152 [Rhamnella rubrinervis]